MSYLCDNCEKTVTQVYGVKHNNRYCQFCVKCAFKPVK